ncbi:MAG: glycosyltransferase family 39 protein [Campylobacterota bacterium]|nr:glycosyltransferase family 39 protein [Campylobacterota bacterium]
MIINKHSIAFISLLLFHFMILLFLVDGYSISYNEAEIFFNQSNLLSHIIDISTSIFGQNDYGLRLPFILSYTLSSILIYLITFDYFKRQRDRFISLSIFMLLPGLNSAALLVNNSIIIVFLTLLFIYLYKKENKLYIFLLPIYLFIDNSFAILFLALFFFALKNKNNYLLIYNLILFGISMSIYGFDIGGIPRGYFIDTFSIYATIFSPVLFLYFFYAIYRIGLKWDKDIFWYISITALGLSLLFSLRQKIQIEDFAPFVVISIPIMTKLFIHSLRVRLKEFRKPHIYVLRIAIGVLLFNFILFVYNKPLYLVLDEPNKHFAYKYNIAKELSLELKGLNINSLHTNDEEMKLRLLFYGIGYSNDKFLTSNNVNIADFTIPINYYGKTINTFYIIDQKK